MFAVIQHEQNMPMQKMIAESVNERAPCLFVNAQGGGDGLG
jgi:hypothetical protein